MTTTEPSKAAALTGGGLEPAPAGQGTHNASTPEASVLQRSGNKSLLGRGFTAALGVLLAAALAFVLITLAEIVFFIVSAIFVALGLNPLVKALQRRGLSRSKAITFVALTFTLAIVLLLWLVIPFALRQAEDLFQSLPGNLRELQNQPWAAALDSTTNGAVGAAAGSLAEITSQPSFWATLGGGVLNLGFGIVDAISSGIFIAVLTLYFLAALKNIKKGFYALTSASKRHSTIYLTEKITDSVGKYLSGMVILATSNAIFSFILLSLTRVQFAALISLAAFFITLIPLIGTVLTTGFMTVFALLSSPTAGLIVFMAMLVYMQVEAYILTPKVMSKAVQVPGALVLISATAGGTLLGLPGALIAIPVAAACSLIVKRIVVPRRSVQ